MSCLEACIGEELHKFLHSCLCIFKSLLAVIWMPGVKLQGLGLGGLLCERNWGSANIIMQTQW